MLGKIEGRRRRGLPDLAVTPSRSLQDWVGQKLKKLYQGCKWPCLRKGGVSNHSPARAQSWQPLCVGPVGTGSPLASESALFVLFLVKGKEGLSPVNDSCSIYQPCDLCSIHQPWDLSHPSSHGKLGDPTVNLFILPNMMPRVGEVRLQKGDASYCSRSHVGTVAEGSHYADVLGSEALGSWGRPGGGEAKTTAEGDVPKEEAWSPSAPCTPGQMGPPSEEAVGSQPWEDHCSLQEVEAPGVSAAGGTRRRGSPSLGPGNPGPPAQV